MIRAVILLGATVFASTALAEEPSAPPANPAASEREVYFKVQLEVNEQGSVDKCEIISTDAPQKMADGVCPIFVSKAKFRPTVDENGNPKRSTFTQTVKFVLKN